MEMKVRDVQKELNVFGIPFSWKKNSFRDFLVCNGFRIVSKDYVDCEYEDVKAYLDLEIERFAK